MSDCDVPVAPQPVPERLSLWRRLLRRLPGFCGYCGRKYVHCHSKRINLLMPLPQNGRSCPLGHEGYVDEIVTPAGDRIRHTFDYVTNPPGREGQS